MEANAALIVITMWVCTGVVAVSVMVCVTAKMKASDPNVQINDFTQLDTSNMPNVPLGNPDSMDLDVIGAPLSPTDFTNSEAISHDPVQTSSEFDPIMMAGMFQGDIVLHTEEELIQMTMPHLAGARNAIISEDRRWPNAVIPYVISSSYSKSERSTIAAAMAEFHRSTCIRFVPRNSEKDYIHILRGDGCYSSVGRTGGAQAVSVGLGCLHVGIVEHELMHATGFWHEHSRFDRDDHITIDYSNIQEGMEYNFEKYDWDTIQSLGVGYDLGEQGLRVNIPFYSAFFLLPQRDIQKLSLLYDCDGFTTGTVTTTAPVGPPAPGGCEDSHNHCGTWSQSGECEKNPDWMLTNCRKACNKCDNTCKDTNVFCNEWSQMGECTRNAPYMSLFCKKSCGVCDEPEPDPEPTKPKKCKNQNKHCKAWASDGQCRVNPAYMLDNCKKACRAC
ncbi:zinc metalloproteinase nas-15-like [Penaeus chinensis]|uniref:zinc metalloproteinase nas-15-like n=1 Tax=Penaeus chinensis TaxID=139456 RepID=UPI001FB5D293|nr:zinc metalloproteinase nas-15-like [Penaeus chinensis]